MKRILFFVFSILFSMGIKAQLAFPTYNQSPIWCMQEYITMEISSISTIELKADTTICDKVYTPLQVNDYPLLEGMNIVLKDSIIGYVRQEQQQVYQLLDSCREMLLYDFSLRLGDTIRYSYNGYELSAFVAQVSHEIIRGVSRKVLALLFPDFNQSQIRYWVEGLGDLQHPLVLFDIKTFLNVHGGKVSRVLCIGDKDGVQFGNCVEACGILSDTEDSNISNSYFKIAPNPLFAGSQINVTYQFKRPATSTIRVVNILGQVLHHQLFTSGASEGSLTLPWMPAVPGAYWLVWQGEQGERYTVPFVVQ